MFPKLSEKAWREINDRLLDLPQTLFHISVPIQLYNNLFDLEKYPITKDMIFEYLRNGGFRDMCPNNKTPSTKENWSFDMGNGCVYGHADSWMDIDSILNEISSYEPKDKIIIIGEIHGWWEKGEE